MSLRYGFRGKISMPFQAFLKYRLIYSTANSILILLISREDCVRPCGSHTKMAQIDDETDCSQTKTSFVGIK
jgi:hypothetical protein